MRRRDGPTHSRCDGPRRGALPHAILDPGPQQQPSHLAAPRFHLRRLSPRHSGLPRGLETPDQKQLSRNSAFSAHHVLLITGPSEKHPDANRRLELLDTSARPRTWTDGSSPCSSRVSRPSTSPSWCSHWKMADRRSPSFGNSTFSEPFNQAAGLSPHRDFACRGRHSDRVSTSDA